MPTDLSAFPDVDDPHVLIALGIDTASASNSIALEIALRIIVSPTNSAYSYRCTGGPVLAEGISRSQRYDGYFA